MDIIDVSDWLHVYIKLVLAKKNGSQNKNGWTGWARRQTGLFQVGRQSSVKVSQDDRKAWGKPHRYVASANYQGFGEICACPQVELPVDFSSNPMTADYNFMPTGPDNYLLHDVNRKYQHAHEW
jgi:hypothetical protein